MLDEISNINPESIILTGFDSEIIGIGNLIDGKIIITNPLTNEIVFEYVIKSDEELDSIEEDELIEGLWDRTIITNVVVYDMDKMIDKLSNDMSYADAYEYFHFNILGGYLGPFTPIFKTNLIN